MVEQELNSILLKQELTEEIYKQQAKIAKGEAEVQKLEAQSRLDAFTAIELILQCGVDLNELEDKGAYDKWESFVKDRLNNDTERARHTMHLAREYGPDPLAGLGRILAHCNNDMDAVWKLFNYGDEEIESD